ncbi:T9SS type A sorting domain-containing protein [Rubrivirga sp.]|uniref:T9SS type A sorting domain-containing protein n=1 Tax=Rubrivirga sp. TaxID=1885344 RepID=UPI003B5154D2
MTCALRTASALLPVRWVVGAVLLVLLAPTALAQSNGQYRSTGSGFWDQTATWQRYNGSGWVAATETPGATNASTITVRDGHTVTVRNALTTNEVVVNAGGKLTVSAALTLQDGSGHELTIFGTVEVFQTLSVPDPSTVSVKNGGVYRHARNGGALPPAGRTTWEAGSTAAFTGLVDAAPSGFTGHSFHHLTWNSPGQTGSWVLGTAIGPIAGNLTVASTGSGGLYWTQDATTPLVVGGSYIQTGGLLVYSYGSSAGTMDVNGGLTVSGGALGLATGSGVPTLRVAGAFAFTGGTIGVLAGSSADVRLDGTVNQTVTSTGTFVGEVEMTLDNPGGATLQSDLVLNDNLKILSGNTFNFNGRNVTVGDDLRVFGSLANASRVTFTSAFGATADLLASAPVSIPEIVVNTDGDPFRFDGAAVTVTTRMTVLAGDVSVINAGTLTVAGGAVYDHARNGGTLPPSAATTWAAGSTCVISGSVNTPPSNLNQSFHHLTWNSPGQTAGIVLGAAPVAINGDLRIVSTGGNGASVLWESSGSSALGIGGRYVQTGGAFVYKDSGSGTMDVAGDLAVSGGTLWVNGNTGNTALRVGGDFALTGGFVRSHTSGSADIVLDGVSNQAITATGAITGPVDLELDNAAGATLQSDLAVPEDFAIEAGTLDLAGYDFTLGDDLQIYVPNGIANASTITIAGGDDDQYIRAPDVLSIPTLVADPGNDPGAGSVVYLDGDVEVTRGVTVRSGTFELRSRSLTLKSVGGRTATLFEDGGSVAVSGSQNLSAERAFGQTGASGWRMLGVPLVGVGYSALNGPFHTQGAAWARAQAGTPNLQRLDVAAQDWDPLGGSDAAFVPGQGYIFYVWDQDPNGTAQLPAVWTVTGPRSAVASVPLGFNTSAGDSHNLVGNPWVANLDWPATVAASTGVGTSYATWDPAATEGGGMSGYTYYNSAGGVGAAGPHIAPFQAFSVQATAGGASLVFRSSSVANDGTPVAVGRRAEAGTPPAGPSPHVRLHFEGGGRGEAETYLVFDGAARAGRDPFDVDRMAPISDEFATVWLGSAGGRLAFDGRPMATGEETFELGLAATVAGTYTLSWPDWHGIPDGWALTLYDRETGRETDLRATPSVPVALAAATPAAALAADAPARFVLRVTDGARVAPTPFRPDGLRMAPNAPNPFAGATTLRYATPDAGPVRLAVYDALGRQVAVLADGEHGAGWHTATWDARGLASGVYVARLVAGPDVQVQRMTVAR